MTRPSDQPNAVETLAFAMFAMETLPGSVALDEAEWRPIWQSVDAITQERYRERAQQQMRDFEDKGSPA